MNKTCIILDYEQGKVFLVYFDDSQDIEQILTENYELNLENIEYMITDKLKIETL